MGGQRHAQAVLRPGKRPGTDLQEAGWAPGPVWTGAGNLAPHQGSIPGPSSPQRLAIPSALRTLKVLVSNRICQNAVYETNCTQFVLSWCVTYSDTRKKLNRRVRNGNLPVFPYCQLSCVILSGAQCPFSDLSHFFILHLSLRNFFVFRLDTQNGNVYSCHQSFRSVQWCCVFVCFVFCVFHIFHSLHYDSVVTLSLNKCT